MSNAGNLIKADNGSGYIDCVGKSPDIVQVAPGSRRHREFVRAYRNRVVYFKAIQ